MDMLIKYPILSYYLEEDFYVKTIFVEAFIFYFFLLLLLLSSFSYYSMSINIIALIFIATLIAASITGPAFEREIFNMRFLLL